jgi:hypothetical protein
MIRPIVISIHSLWPIVGPDNCPDQPHGSFSNRFRGTYHNPTSTWGMDERNKVPLGHLDTSG